MIRVNLTRLALLSALVLVIISSCKKGTEKGSDNKTDGSMVVKTIDVTYAGISAHIKASVSGTLEVISMGICFGTSPNPTISNTVINTTRKGNYEFTVIAGSEACVKQYVRAFATVKGGQTYYGDELTFTNVGPLNDCHPFNGTWKNSTGTTIMRGNWLGFVFHSIAANPKPEINWRGAADARLIAIGNTQYVKDIVRIDETTWKGNVLWYKGNTATNVVTEVKYAPATISLSTDKKQVTISGSSPFGTGPSTGLLYKE